MRSRRTGGGRWESRRGLEGVDVGGRSRWAWAAVSGHSGKSVVWSGFNLMPMLLLMLIVMLLAVCAVNVMDKISDFDECRPASDGIHRDCTLIKSLFVFEGYPRVLPKRGCLMRSLGLSRWIEFGISNMMKLGLRTPVGDTAVTAP